MLTQVADVPRRGAAQPLEGGQPRRRRLRPASERGYSQTRDRERAALHRTSGAIGKTLFNELRVQWLNEDTTFTPTSRRAGGPGAERVQRRRRAARRLAADPTSCRSPTTSTSPTGRHAIRTGLQLDAGAIAPTSCATPAARSRSPASTPTTPGMPTTYTRNAGDPDVEHLAGAARPLRAGRHPRAQGSDRSAPACGRSISRTSAASTSRRAAASPGRRSRAARRRSAAAAASSSTGSTRRATSRRVQLDGTHQQIETIVQPGYPNPALGGRAVALPAGRVQFAAEPRAADADRGDRRRRAGAARRRACQHDVHPPPRHEPAARRERQRAARRRPAARSGVRRGH